MVDINFPMYSTDCTTSYYAHYTYKRGEKKQVAVISGFNIYKREREKSLYKQIK